MPKKRPIKKRLARVTPGTDPKRAQQIVSTPVAAAEALPVSIRRIDYLWPAMLPLIHLALVAGIAAARGPFHLAGNLDPAYHYLFNAVKVTDFTLPDTVQHPGTSVLLITAFVVFVGWLLDGLGGDWQSRIASVVEHHEAYLVVTAWIQVLLIVGLSYLVGLRIFRLTRSVWVAVAAQIVLLLSIITIDHAFRVAAEPMQLVAGLGVLYVLAPLTLNPRASQDVYDPVRSLWVGALLAVGVATRYNFVVATPLLLLLPGWRERLRGCLACGVVLVVLMLPVWGNLDHFLEFASGPLNEAGTDAGRASEGLLDKASALVKQVLQANPTVSWGLLLFFLTAFVASAMMEQPEGERYRLAISTLYAGSLVLVAHTLLATLRIRPHYFMTGLAIVCIMAPHMAYVLHTARLNRFWRYGLTGAVAVIAGQLLFSTALGYRTASRHFHRVHEQARLLDAKRAERPDCEVVGYYPSSASAYALSFGNDFTVHHYGEELEAALPGQLTYSPFWQRFTNWKGQDRRHELEARMAAGQCVLIQGADHGRRSVAGMQRHPLFFPHGFGDSVEGLYRLTLDASNPALFDYNPLPGNSMVIEAEEFRGGNVSREERNGLTVITAGAGPAFATYEHRIRRDQRNVIQVRYASPESRPVKVWLNDELLMDTACILPTPGSGPKHFRWHDLGGFRWPRGDNTIRFSSDGPFPAIDKIAFIEIP